MKISKQEVTLLDSMGTDLSVVNAARVSFDKASEWGRVPLTEDEMCNCMAWSESECACGNYSKEPLKVLAEKDQKLIKYLAKHNHWSPFSHATASFRVKAPIFVARQLAKHQVGFSWNEVSRRYVDSEPEFYVPPKWRKKADNVKQGSSEESVFSDATLVATNYDKYEGPEYTEFYKIALTVYQDLLKDGVCPEQARMVLPQNTMTEWVWTGTLYAWARMCLLRLDSHTQKETQEVAQKISQEMEKLFPVSWKTLMEVK